MGWRDLPNPPSRPASNYDYDGESFFQEMIWPALYERSSRLSASPSDGVGGAL